jgi:glyceraldehyde-3-phosphate dehydrogenase type I
MVKIAINGFGRIGRSVLRALIERNEKINVVAINDIHGIKDAEYSFKYDSIYGKFKGKISTKGNYLTINKRKILILSERDPEKLPWKKLNVDFVIESTGVFRDKSGAMKHLIAGAKKVIVTAPMKNPGKDVLTLVPGVNNKKLKPSHKLISVASCTTNATAPIAKVLNDNFGIKFALMSTVHGYTSSQSLVDSSNEKDPRRGRAAAINLIPTTTGASEAVTEALPELKGKIDGTAIRAPLPDGSIIDFVAEVKKPVTKEKVNSVFAKAAKSEMKGIIEYSTEDLVSSDIIGNTHSAVFDSKMTQVEGNLVKVFAWYDNEFGYSNRVVDAVKMLK